MWSEKYTESTNGVSKKYLVIKVISGTISGTTASWGQPVRLSALGRDAKNPSMAISSSGSSATVVWQRNDGSHDIVQARSGTINGKSSTWGGVTDLSAVGFLSQDATVVVSADGARATAVWSRIVKNSILVRTRSAVINGISATWGGSATISPPTQKARFVKLGVSADGSRAGAAWVAGNVIQAAFATIVDDTASWGSPSDVSTATGATFLTNIAVSQDGANALVAWRRRVGVKYVFQTSAAAVTANSPTWSSITDVSDTSGTVVGVDAHASADGLVAVAAWEQSGSDGKDVIRGSVGTSVHPTATPTPVIPDTPTPTPTPAATATPIGQQSREVPTPGYSSNDGRVVLHIRVQPQSFKRVFVGYLLRASDNQLASFGKFRMSGTRGRLVLNHLPSGQYIAFIVVRRSKAPRIISSRYRTVTVK